MQATPPLAALLRWLRPGSRETVTVLAQGAPLHGANGIIFGPDGRWPLTPRTGCLSRASPMVRSLSTTGPETWR